jgi:hypothetical protein
MTAYNNYPKSRENCELRCKVYITLMNQGVRPFYDQNLSAFGDCMYSGNTLFKKESKSFCIEQSDK